MTPLATLLDQFQTSGVWLVLKGMYILAFAIYVVFAVIVLTQIRQMVATLSGGFDGHIKLLGWVHVLIALGALILAFVVL